MTFDAWVKREEAKRDEGRGYEWKRASGKVGDDAPRLLTLSQAARVIGCCPHTVNNFYRKGILPAVEGLLAEQRRYHPDEVARVAAQYRNPHKNSKYWRERATA